MSGHLLREAGHRTWAAAVQLLAAHRQFDGGETCEDDGCDFGAFHHDAVSPWGG